jgi:hypothetical protein
MSVHEEQMHPKDPRWRKLRKAPRERGAPRPTRTTGSTVRSGAKNEVRKEGASVEMLAGVVIYTVAPDVEGFTLVTGDAGLWTGETAEIDLGI